MERKESQDQPPILDIPITRRQLLRATPWAIGLIGSLCQQKKDHPSATMIMTQEPEILIPPKYQRQLLPDRIKGINFPAWNREEYQQPSTIQSLEDMMRLQPNTVGIIATHYQKSISSTDIYDTESTPSKNSLEFIINEAHKRRKNVMLKIHVIIQGDGWHGQIGTDFEDTQWKRWFNTYHNMFDPYIELAQDTGVELLVIGNELITASVERPQDWREIIDRTRKKGYAGKLTYAANREDYQAITWWDAVDYIGLDPYFPLSQNFNPTLTELRKKWAELAVPMKQLTMRWNKSMIFPEIGYPSAKGAAKEPWKYTLIDNPAVPVDIAQQANCIQALLETLWDETWWAGVVLWDWHTDPNIGGIHDKHYTPKGKPAEKIIIDYHSR